MRWRIALRSQSQGLWAGLPPEILTIAPRFRHESMPDEVGILLPTNDGPKTLVDAIAGSPDRSGDGFLGLFLASPFLNLNLEGRRLTNARVSWITNLPSVAQQDEDFLQQLADVGLDYNRELECLAKFRAHDFKIAVVVTNRIGAAAAAAIAPEAMIVLPRIADFAAGFPSMRQRGAAAQAVAEAAQAAGWSGLLLGLADEREADHETLWPERLHGVLCRPRPG